MMELMLQKELLKLKLMIDGELYAMTASLMSKLMWFVDSYDLVHTFYIMRIPVFHHGLQHTTLMIHCVKMAEDFYSVLVVILLIGDVPAHI